MILAAAMSLEAFTTDREIALLKKGDPDAVSDLIGRYQHRLYRFLVRLVQDPATAEDLFQQTWIRLMEKIGSYDARRSFEAWLFAIARNLAIDHLRRRRAISLDEQDESGQAPMDRLTAGGRDALEQLLDFERGALLAAAITELPAIHREVLTLRFEEEMKLEQIAEIAAIPLSTVKSRLHRALESLRIRIEKGRDL
ncbi:MAG TPA: sigma-70 family RNA polymerase sigma factor [Bryobacteraceae bacterium]|jgi:RNA polymerase sigma-70 factor (ECF subfamily)|nr:sigma-70 family RNA polymerase sigma factor [Bryobacteraceae bacterium]